MPINLSKQTILNLITQNSQKERVFTDQKISGLKLRITTNKTATFYFYYKIASKLKKYRIGAFPEITPQVARTQAVKLKAQLELGQDPQKQRNEQSETLKGSTTPADFSTFLQDHYFPYAYSHHKSCDSTRRILNNTFGFLHNKKLSEISPIIIDQWQQKRLADGIKPSSINRHITALIACLNKAVEWEILDVNPLSNRKKLKVDKKGVVRFLSEDEEARLLSAASCRVGGHANSIILLLLNTGARPKEIFNLKWEDISKKQITLQAAFSKTGQTRYVPLNKVALDCIAKIDRRHETWVFPSPMNPNRPIVSISKTWHKILVDANISNFRLYDLRHTFASKLVMRGVSLYAVSELLGHSSTDMTKIYAHLSQAHLQDAVALL